MSTLSMLSFVIHVWLALMIVGDAKWGQQIEKVLFKIRLLSWTPTIEWGMFNVCWNFWKIEYIFWWWLTFDLLTSIGNNN
jgi:hypothetical protein